MTDSKNQVETIYSENKKPRAFAKAYLEYLSGILTKMDLDSIGGFIELLQDARERGARIFFIGNGGSAATASHFANDLGFGTRTWKKPFRALSLTDNVAVITALGNDYGYDDIFVLQLKTQIAKGDVVVAISASGNSPNIVKAIEYANEVGAITVGMTGFDGGKLRKIAKSAVHVPSQKGEYGPVEDVHMIMDHLVGAFLVLACREENG
jgi:D-sedoheptulose 7-phosphate isomerase